MKWPWVSREHHDDVVRDLRRSHQATVDDLRLRADDMAIRIIEIMTKPVVASATVTTPQGKWVLDPAPEADAITKTIREEAGRDTHLAQHLRKYARELKAQGMNDDAIVAKLIKWQTSEPEDHAASA